MMSIFAELKRRNVFKVAAAYIIVAWVLLQVSDTLAPALYLPGWFHSGVAFVLILGFPVAIIFAWAWEMTPEGLKKEKKADYGKSDSKTADDGVEEIGPADPQVIEKSIAVLPFVNMSEDSSNEFFSDGISEELLNLLSRIPELRVAARTSSFALKGKELQINEVGDILKVANVLEGSVRKNGNQVRITVQLIKVSDGYHLWSETYDHKLDDIFAIQDSIATSVVKQLKLTLLGETPTADETDPEAYTLFLQARQLVRQGTVKAWEQSISLFKRSLAIAPGYAASWAGLANVYNEQAAKVILPVDEAFALARNAAQRALEINPQNANAHASLGFISHSYDNDLEAAVKYLSDAIALEPGNPEILTTASNLAVALGRLEEGISIREYAVASDPVNPSSLNRLGVLYIFGGRLDEAINSINTALNLSPGRIAAQWALGLALLLKGEPEAALAAMKLESDSGTGWEHNGMALAYHELGMAAESDAALEKLITGYGEGSEFNVAYIEAFRGNADSAFQWLDKSVQFKDPGLVEIPVHPLLANIHGDSRWLPFLERIGRSPEQLAAIEFNVTLPG